MQNIKNIAIIAHVDHGKTTLVDALLRQSKTEMKKEVASQEMIMDSNELERERGITIFSKNASVMYGETKINIIDTPGHADFGGEVERVLNMADGCLLLVDAKEGPMPQTRFVLKKALEMGQKIIVVINKIDKQGARAKFALEATFELFLELGAHSANSGQAGDFLEFPVIYASGRDGLAGLENDITKMTDITPIFEAILEHIPSPIADTNKPLQMLVTSIVADDFKGRIAIGRVYNGFIKAGQDVMHIDRAGIQKKYKITSLLTFAGLGRIETQEVQAGDICGVSGIEEITIGETIASVENPEALPLINIESPTVKMTFMVNNSPFAGKEGEFSTSRQIRARLFKELETDVALRAEDTNDGKWTVSGRGELHLAILIERMRREGFEFAVSRPQVILREVNGKMMTPYEKVFIEVPEQYQGAVIQNLGGRKGEIKEMRTHNGIAFLEFIIPTKGLFGYRNEFLTDTKGLGIINTAFFQYMPDPGSWKERDHGSLVSTDTGPTNMYGLRNVQNRGTMFFNPAVQVYQGQVVGQNSRPNDIWVNVCKEKALSNMRSKGEGNTEHFNVPKTMGLEDALEYIGDDELVEVTPKNIRIRKVHLTEVDAKRADRAEAGVKFDY
ncbi:MAG: GTP-binding protein TypA [Candidatus Staskawiczbacteria bacterium RIFOXYD1_FULL_39_28]|uniref:50S ribosomal subunit assembly factor BipA n=1 Tax=Candidatus Staskawiczbacteria bacterium RIFOXYC1_FULL_38_18 TaxID=1802229 RepID=A0A1G2JBN4_9BACT|nr:MAG: GTP-binding protein TypA [Candidatus Staskawiczbacteria bacterium RIFOXYC1_FULL_38_18]OGZ90547.1 MAG: GTP-binding protein TypA [Candidatus Staskawiczbacteria bacterium RIFOXYD1_FULL_39_28]